MFSSASTDYKGSVSSNVMQKVVLFSQTRQLIIDTLSYESNRKFNCKWYEKMLLHPPNSVLCTCKPRTDGKAKHLEEKHGFDWFHISSRNKSQLTFTAKQHGQLYPQKTKVLFCKKSFDGFHSKTQTFLPGIKASWPLLLNNTDNCTHKKKFCSIRKGHQIVFHHEFYINARSHFCHTKRQISLCDQNCSCCGFAR